MLELADIQAIVFSGHGHMPHSRFLLVQIEEPKAAKALLARLVPQIATGERRARGAEKPKSSISIAFTASGLTALGLTSDALDTFPREFTEGMTGGERPRVLDDTGDCAPENWQFGGPKTPPIDILLSLYSTSEAVMESLTREDWYPAAPGSGLRIVYEQDSIRRTDNEPFGFRDGIAQPAIEGSPVPTMPGQAVLKPGEFLLGYTNGYDNISTVPTVPAAQDPANLLPPADGAPALKGFGRNGSFLVLRKLAQDVEKFWQFCEDKTRNPDGTPNPQEKEKLAAKIVGRWRSGAPLNLAPDHDDPALGKDNQRNDNFLFAESDGKGFACPIGSHMRRSNPRDALEPNSPKRALVISNRHRIVRRGRPYVDPLPSPPAPLAHAEDSSAVPEELRVVHAVHRAAHNNGPVEQGLIFLAINADIERQFEFVQQTWLNSPKFNGLYDNPDPLLANSTGDGVMVLQSCPVRQKIHGLPRFVQMRGGGYFFLPGLRALRFLAALPEGGAQITTPLQAAGTTGGQKMSLLKSVWSSVLTEGHKLHDELLNLREMVDKDFEGLLGKPGLIRPLFDTLRKHDPILVVPKLAVVSLYPDVLEVLDNEAVFSVVPIYAKKMEATTGDFVLGMDDTPQYKRETGWMRQATKPDDLKTIGKLVNQWSADLVAAAAGQGRLDVVAGLSRVVPTRLVGTYFGAPGPDDATTMRWMRTIFREIFLNLGNDPEMAQAADVSAKELNAYLDSVIAQRKAEIAAGKPSPDDFLTRLVRLQATSPEIADEAIRRMVGGTIVGTVDTNSKAIAQAVDQLLDRPTELQAAHDAAQADNDDLVARYVFEALRFNPQNPFLLRQCEQDYTVAAGTDRAKKIPKGDLVLVGTESAMFDPAKFPDPDSFRIDRPAESYIHFGHGIHTCFGKYIATLLIPTVAKHLLKLNNLRRESGDEGKLRNDGAFPDHLVVRFDA